jgi:flavin reductase (DIM6/NTAB) family NADH-FMN oxidoreductase RutF
MKKQIGIFDAVERTLERLNENTGGDGLLLIAGENGNPMAIGWANIGVIWGLPILTVLVRPSRYTFELIENSGEFSVNVLGPLYAEQILHCGTHSGRDEDKVSACGFALEQGKEIAIPHLREAEIVYECRTVHKNNVINAALDASIVKHHYPQGDYHSVYYGEILGVYREE